MPENIIKNITGQIRPQMPVIKRLVDYTPDEIKKVPRLFEWFDLYVCNLAKNKYH